MQAHVLTAPGDGVGPAVLLSVGGGASAAGGSGTQVPPAQYLFNAPEGFARLALEHKLRPGRGLRALFATDAASLSGVGGLLMRLRGEGHDQLHVVAPSGGEAAVCSLRHFIHWRHPAVLLEEASPWERQPTVYEDDRIAVAALWKPPLLAGMWPAPHWLQHAQPVRPASSAGAHAKGASSSSSSEESSSEESSSEESSSEESSSAASSSEESGSEGNGSGDSSSGGNSAAAPSAGGSTAMGNGMGGGTARGGMFEELDRLFMGGSGGKRLVLDRLKASAPAAAVAVVGPPAGQLAPAGVRPTRPPASGLAAGAHQLQSGAAAAAAAATAAAKAAAAAGAPGRRRQTVEGTPADEDADVAVIGGKRFCRLPGQAGINVWVCRKLGGRAAAAANGQPHTAAAAASARGTAGGGLGGSGAQAQAQAQGQGRPQAGAPPADATSGLAQQRQQPAGQHEQQVLGFLCHLKATDQLLLITNLHSRAAAAQLQEHPAVALLQQQGPRVAAVMHLAAPGVAGSRGMRQLTQQLQAAGCAEAGGRQVVLDQPGAHPSSQVIGHLAAARTTSKLNLISSRIFPLPAGVRLPPAPGTAAQPVSRGPGDSVVGSAAEGEAASGVATQLPASASGATPEGEAASGVAAQLPASAPGAAQEAEAASGISAQLTVSASVADGEGEAAVGALAGGHAAVEAVAAAASEPDTHAAVAGSGDGTEQQAVPPPPQQQQQGKGVQKGNGAGAVGGAASGLVHVRHVSVLRWQQQPGPAAAAVGAAAAAGPAANGSRAGIQALPAQQQQQQQQQQQVLVLEPGEVYASMCGDAAVFDAGAVQREVQEERPQLQAELEFLWEQQRQGGLPGAEQLQAAAGGGGSGGAGGKECRPNQVAQPAPPPLPQLPQHQHQLAAGWQHAAAQQQWQQQQQQQLPPPSMQYEQQQQLQLPPSSVQQWQQQQMQPPAFAIQQQQQQQLPPPSMQQQYQQQQQLQLPPSSVQQWQQQQLQPPAFAIQQQQQQQPAFAAQQQQQEQQPAIMRALYQHPQQQPSLAPSQLWQLPMGMQATGQGLLHTLPPQAWNQGQALPAVAGSGQYVYAMPQPPPPPAALLAQSVQQAPPPQQQQAQPVQQQAQPPSPALDNKRAAEGLRERLQGGKRPRQHSDSGTGLKQAEEEPPSAGTNTLPADPPLWLQGVPPCILQLATSSSGSGSSQGAAAAAAAARGPEVVFLGTGSAEPSKYRAASAIQLRLSCGQSLLMDCGEGTLGALCRTYGTAAALRQVASLGCLWVSHRHADHMSGVLPLLAAYPASLPPLLVVGPRSLRDWLAEAAPALRLAGRYRFVHSLEMNQPDHWARQALQRHLGITHLHCVPVRHCSDAFGLVVRHQEGWSLVYSGDTQPCQQLVQAGMGCTLLIHEATFEPCLEQQARQKRHSTTAEALQVAQRMGAYRCILTHFSQRYPKWPEGLPHAEAAQAGGSSAAEGATVPAPPGSAGAVAVAFDGMRVPLALLPVLPVLMAAVKAAMGTVEEEEEEQGEGVEEEEGRQPVKEGQQQRQQQPGDEGQQQQADGGTADAV